MSASGKIRGRLVTRARDRDAAEACAERLRALGFVVSSASALGINVSGPPELFESVFHAAVDLQNEPRFASEPVIPAELSDAVAAVYLPTQPLYFEE